MWCAGATCATARRSRKCGSCRYCFLNGLGVGLLSLCLRCYLLLSCTGIGVGGGCVTGQTELRGACGLCAPVLLCKQTLCCLNLLFTGSVHGGTGHADTVPGLLGELQTAVEAVTGVDGPVTTGLALCQCVPGSGICCVCCGNRHGCCNCTANGKSDAGLLDALNGLVDDGLGPGPDGRIVERRVAAVKGGGGEGGQGVGAQDVDAPALALSSL